MSVKLSLRLRCKFQHHYISFRSLVADVSNKRFVMNLLRILAAVYGNQDC
jgi:hypothetical protein